MSERDMSGPVRWERRFKAVVAWAVLAIGGLTGAPDAGAQPPIGREYEVKTGFIYHFLRFTRWPEEAFQHPGSPLLLCVAAGRPEAGVLTSLRNKMVSNRKIDVRLIDKGLDGQDPDGRSDAKPAVPAGTEEEIPLDFQPALSVRPEAMVPLIPALPPPGSGLFSGNPVAASPSISSSASPPDSPSTSPSDFNEKCHALFIASDRPDFIHAGIEKHRGPHVLIMGEAPGALRLGVMINFIIREDRLRFEVNPDAVAEAGLRLSSQLLMSASIYRPEKTSPSPEEKPDLPPLDLSPPESSLPKSSVPESSLEDGQTNARPPGGTRKTP